MTWPLLIAAYLACLLAAGIVIGAWELAHAIARWRRLGRMAREMRR